MLHRRCENTGWPLLGYKRRRSGQDEEERSLGRDPEQALAQFEEGLEIGGDPAADRNQTILVELRGLNKQGALLGRVIAVVRRTPSETRKPQA